MNASLRSAIWKAALVGPCFILAAGIAVCIFDGAADVETAWSALEKGDLNQAIRFSSRAISFGCLSGEKLGSAYECRASASLRKKSFDRALSDLDRLVELRPDYAGARLLRGEALFRAKKPDQALAEMNKGLELADPKGDSKSPHLAKRFVARGNIHFARRDPDRAMADFDRALALDPSSLDARMGRSYVLQARGQKREALVEMELVWQVVSKRVFMDLSRQSVYLKRVIDLRMANGFDPQKPASVIPAEAPPIPAAGDVKAEDPDAGSREESPLASDLQPDEVSESNLDKPLLGR